ncbi:unnamed protein product, partial [Amoebophrya sp. A25]
HAYSSYAAAAHQLQQQQMHPGQASRVYPLPQRGAHEQSFPAAPGFSMDPVTASVWGPEEMWSAYSTPIRNSGTSWATAVADLSTGHAAYATGTSYAFGTEAANPASASATSKGGAGLSASSSKSVGGAGGGQHQQGSGSYNAGGSAGALPPSATNMVGQQGTPRYN